MTGQHRIVVLGAGYAGLAAARRLARKARGADVTVVDARTEFVERVRLHQRFAGQQTRAWDLRALLEPQGVGFVHGRVTELDAERSLLRFDNREPLGYDTLIYTLGSADDDCGVPGVAGHAYSVATPESAARIPADGPIVVVGAGATGIEVAAELAESRPGTRVELVGTEEPGAWLSPRAQAHIQRVLDGLGVRVHAGEKVIEVSADAVRLADGTSLESRATVWTTGFGVPQLAARAGLAVDAHGRVRTDATLRSVSHPNIYAAGDSAVVAGPGGRELRMACATALPTGSYAADAVTARLRGREPGELNFRYHLQCLSLGRRDGVIQFVHADDAPGRMVLTGRTAARVKEAIVRFAAAGAGAK
ncbi:NAD(P)/FAD-dependent oxidoreductase [Nocardia cyriacigeorgica]|uniref:Putative oxidoreductase n=1 Tax=Nocardia cyriacigeorgica (strain GUH-2) TaxID=1127134 RepID=H6R529_NOCCG|nr:FAD-dependent oxidoreductase [Nocardia cyriacigeorgica]CCF65853.1 putative oxidoreductase [Nocardia cyriacigeorgica GUH-2]